MSLRTFAADAATADNRRVDVRLPHTIDDVLTVANTRHGSGAHRNVRVSHAAEAGPHDHLGDASDARQFLADHGVAIPAGAPADESLEQLRVIRDLVHRLADRRPGAARMALAAVLSAAHYGLTTDGSIHSKDDGWPGFAQSIAAATVPLLERGERLRRCDNPACRWLFVDESRRGDRRWCDMAVCGNRAKGTRYRHRRRVTA